MAVSSGGFDPTLGTTGDPVDEFARHYEEWVARGGTTWEDLAGHAEAARADDGGRLADLVASKLAEAKKVREAAKGTERAVPGKKESR